MKREQRGRVCWRLPTGEPAPLRAGSEQPKAPTCFPCTRGTFPHPVQQTHLQSDLSRHQHATHHAVSTLPLPANKPTRGFCSRFLPAARPVPFPVGAPALSVPRGLPSAAAPSHAPQEHPQRVCTQREAPRGDGSNHLPAWGGGLAPPGPAGQEQFAWTLAKAKRSKSDSNSSTSELPAYRRTPPTSSTKCSIFIWFAPPSPLPFQTTALVLHLLPDP